MKQKTMNLNQASFLARYLETGDAIKSYLNVYNCKESTAIACSSNLLKQPHIREELDRHRATQLTNAALTPQRLLREEQRLSMSTFADAFSEDGELLPFPELPEDLQRAISGIDITDVILQVTESGDTTETRISRKYKYRLWDKGKSLERNERHLGMFEKDNQQHSQAPVININYAGREGAEHQRIYELVMDNLYLLPAEFQKLIAPAIPQDKTPTLPEPIPPTEQLPQDIG